MWCYPSIHGKSPNQASAISIAWGVQYYGLFETLHVNKARLRRLARSACCFTETDLYSLRIPDGIGGILSRGASLNSLSLFRPGRIKSAGSAVALKHLIPLRPMQISSGRRLVSGPSCCNGVE